MSLHANLSFVFHQVAEINLNINALFYALKNEIGQGHKKREQKEKIGFSSVCPFDVHEERLNCTLECLLSSTHYFIKHFTWNKLRWQARFPGIGINLITVINPFNLLLGILPKIAF